jgi:hypothetical protein
MSTPTDKRKEILFWSIALPGFGQLLNGRWLKGGVLIFLEFLVNIQSNLNTAIIYSFHGNIVQSIQHTDFQWLMFYPCLYTFAIWDAYQDAGGRLTPFSFLPFVFSAYVGTIGVIYSSSVSIAGQLLGPIWLPILFLLLGAAAGWLIQVLLTIRNSKAPIG